MIEQRKCKALIFDMDGTMIANKEYHDRAWIQFCNELSIEIDITEFSKQYTGKTNAAILELVFQRKLHADEIEKYQEYKESLYRKIYSPHFKLVDGLLETLRKAKKSELLLAIATSAPRSNVDFVCSMGGILHFFDGIIDASMVVEGKPSPEVFFKAADVLHVLPEQCICFEDSKAGIEASRAAGMYTIGIANEFSIPKLIDLGAHEAYSDFNGFLQYHNF